MRTVVKLIHVYLNETGVEWKINSLPTKVSSLVNSYSNPNSSTPLETYSSSPTLLCVASSKSKYYSVARGPSTETINVDDVKDSVGTELKKQLLSLADNEIQECEIPVTQTVVDQWQSNEYDFGNLLEKLTESSF